MSIYLVSILNNYVVNLCQLLALFIIFTGIIKILITCGMHIFTSFDSASALITSQLEFNRTLYLGMSFLVGECIFKIIIKPSWSNIGQLGTVVILTLALNDL